MTRENIYEENARVLEDELGVKITPINVSRSHLPPHDPVNHPSHYTDGQIEVSDFIADKNFNFFLGNVIKYVSRAGKKDPTKYLEDLKKAEWYLKREIQRISDDAVNY